MGRSGADCKDCNEAAWFAFSFFHLSCSCLLIVKNLNKHYSFSKLKKGLVMFSFSVILDNKVLSDLAK